MFVLRSIVLEGRIRSAVVWFVIFLCRGICLRLLIVKLYVSAAVQCHRVNRR